VGMTLTRKGNHSWPWLPKVVCPSTSGRRIFAHAKRIDHSRPGQLTKTANATSSTSLAGPFANGDSRLPNPSRSIGSQESYRQETTAARPLLSVLNKARQCPRIGRRRVRCELAAPSTFDSFIAAYSWSLMTPALHGRLCAWGLNVDPIPNAF
jgi:hypothetical protein